MCRILLAVSACLLAFPACQSREDSRSSVTTNSSTESASDNHADNSTVSAQPVIDAQLMSWKEIEAFLQSHKGKVVVADIWSTSCIPCMRELPHLFALQKTYPEDIVAVSINIDYIGLPDETPEQSKEKSLEFLRQHKDATITNLVSSTPDEDVFAAVGIASIPVVLMYDREGKLVKKFGLEGNGFTYAENVTPFVKKLLP